MSGMIMAIAVAGASALAVHAKTFYFDSEGGLDENDGLSEATAWRSLDKANQVPAGPGDKVLFKRGGIWRGSLIPKSGEEGRPILYSSYGKGPKPVFQQSVDRSAKEHWFEESPGIWSTARPKLDDGHVVWTDSDGAWYGSFQDKSKGRVKRVTENGETFVRVTCLKRPEPIGFRKVLAPSSVQVWGPELPDVPASCVLKMKLRASKPFVLGRVAFSLPVRPYTTRSSGRVPNVSSSPLTADWQEVAVLMHGTGGNGSFHLSIGDAIPEDCTFDIKVTSLAAVNADRSSFIEQDVGIVVLDHGAQWGRKKMWGAHELEKDLDYWYDPAYGRVLMKYPANPGSAFKSIELAKTVSVVREANCHDVVYDGLAVRYTGAHGFGGGNTLRLTIRNCDIYWVGGGLQYWQTSAQGRRYPVRYGNGIEFWGHCRDNLVERNRLWQIYDAALTSQTLGSPLPEIGIVWRDNVVWQAEYSFEYWNHDPRSCTANVLVEHNTFVDAGFCWSHDQRPNPNGAHLMFYANPAATTNFVVRNNIFARTTERSIRMWNDWLVKNPAAKDGLEMLNNLYFIPENSIAELRFPAKGRNGARGAKRQTFGAGYGEFSRYKAETGLDANSIWGEPAFVNPAVRDYRLKPGTPGANSATDGGPMGARDMPGLDADQSAD